MIEPLHLSFEVACHPSHAFAVWTEQIASWWPISHTVSAERGLTVSLEPFVGGRIYERTPAGEEIDWGEILTWEPPHRFSYLWHLRTDRSDATEVGITFNATDSGSTLVEIQHRGWERLGARGPAWREANRAGWGGLLPHFIAACASAA